MGGKEFDIKKTQSRPHQDLNAASEPGKDSLDFGRNTCFPRCSHLGDSLLLFQPGKKDGAVNGGTERPCKLQALWKVSVQITV